MQKVRSLVAAVAATAILVLGGVAVAQESKFFKIGTGSAGGTYFPIGGLIANAISSPPGSRSCDEGGSCGVPGLVAIAVSTHASVANVNAIQSGRLDAGLSGSFTIYEAYNGVGRFEGKKKEKLRALTNLYPEDMHIVLPKGLQLDSIKDLKGKRVGIGQSGSGTQSFALRVLEHYGISRDDIDAAELNVAQSAQRIADGQMDAFFYAIGTPAAALVQLGSIKGFDLYKFSEDEQNEITEIIPYYTVSAIQPGTYEGIDYEVPTVSVNAQIVTSADQPEELIYEIANALWNENTRKLLDNGHAKGKVIQLDTALKGVQIPLHPGAERYYKEKGLIQ